VGEGECHPTQTSLRDSNPNHVTLGLGKITVSVTQGHHRGAHGRICVIRRLFNNNYFATSAILAAGPAAHTVQDGDRAGAQVLK